MLQHNDNDRINGKPPGDPKNINEAPVPPEIKSKETLEWEEALKNWVNR